MGGGSFERGKGPGPDYTPMLSDFEQYEGRHVVQSTNKTLAVVFAVSLIFTYNAWFCAFMGVLVASMGIYGASMPVLNGKIKFILMVRRPRVHRTFQLCRSNVPCVVL